nr:hypothetical protein Iba_chr15bCG7440 [Ipomoea batatas]
MQWRRLPMITMLPLYLSTMVNVLSKFQRSWINMRIYLISGNGCSNQCTCKQSSFPVLISMQTKHIFLLKC